MSKLYTSSVLFLLFLFLNVGKVFSQIVINGPRPINLYNQGGGELYVSLSYGYNFWKDGKQKEFKGHSSSVAEYGLFSDFISFDKFDYSSGPFLGLEKGITDRFSVKGNLFYAKMTSGLSTRADLEISDDKSKFFQMSAYSSLSLTKDKGKILSFQWLIGPEIIYAQKDLIIKEYMESSESESVDYHYKESVMEVSLVTGFGASIRLMEKLFLFSDGLIGISLPGKGIKVSSHNIGLKYRIN